MKLKKSTLYAMFLVFTGLLVPFFFLEMLFFKMLLFVLILLFAAGLIFKPELIRAKLVGDYIIEDENHPPYPDGTEGTVPESGETEVNEGFEIVPKGGTPHGTGTVIDRPMDLPEKYAEIATEVIPDQIRQSEQFYFVIEKVLYIIRDTFQAHSAIFFKYKKKTGVMQVGRSVCGGPNFVRAEELPLENDIISKALENKAPEILTTLSATVEADHIIYYTKPMHIRSVIAVPVFYHNSVIGAVVIDSVVADAFGIETIYSLGRFVRLIALIMQLFKERSAENISQQRLDWLIEFLAPLNTLRKNEEIINLIDKHADTLLPWKAFSLVLYDPEQKKFYTEIVKNTTGLRYIGEGHEIDMKGTVVGKTILLGKPQLHGDTSSLNLKRYSGKEETVFAGSFLTIPLKYNKKNYGVLCFDHLDKNAYREYDKEYIESISSLLSFIIYSFTSQNLYKNMSAYDRETRLFNEKIFRTLMRLDFDKSKKADITSTLILFKIDDFVEQETLFDDDPLSECVIALTNLLREEIPPSSIAGRIDERKFGIFVFNYSPKEAFVWAERFRIKVARLNIQAVGKQMLFTTSCGIASTKGRPDMDTMLQQAEEALKKAIDDGGNKINNMH